MTSSSSVASDLRRPLMTIAVPTFNRAGLLKGCVASAMAQTYPHFEVVVSNNASSDDTRHVLSEVSDARLRVIHQATNIGMHPNFNSCLANARGDYIVFVSDDDRLAPWFLERCARLIDQEPQLSTVIALSNLHAAPLGRTKPARISRTHDTGIWDGSEILMDFLTDQITVTMCSVLMRTDLLRARGGLSLNLPHTADVAAWAPLLLLGKAGFVNEACATFTYYGASETLNLGVEQLLRDGREVVELIEHAADSLVADLQKRRAIRVQARRCFARRGLIALSYYRSGGGRIHDLLNVLWRFRQDLCRVNLVAVLRFAAIIFCPQPLATQLRQLGHNIPERLA